MFTLPLWTLHSHIAPLQCHILTHMLTDTLIIYLWDTSESASLRPYQAHCTCDMGIAPLIWYIISHSNRSNRIERPVTFAISLVFTRSPYTTTKETSPTHLRPKNLHFLVTLSLLLHTSHISFALHRSPSPFALHLRISHTSYKHCTHCTPTILISHVSPHQPLWRTGYPGLISLEISLWCPHVVSDRICIAGTSTVQWNP